MKSGLNRREIENYSSSQYARNYGREEEMRPLWRCVESWRRKSPHPEGRERASWVDNIITIFEAVLVLLAWVLTGAVTGAVTVVGVVVMVLVRFIKAIILRMKLSVEVLRQDLDVRTKTGRVLIIVFQLSLREELEIYLDDCIEVREEKIISEFELWSTFFWGSLIKVLRYRAKRISRQDAVDSGE